MSGIAAEVREPRGRTKQKKDRTDCPGFAWLPSLVVLGFGICLDVLALGQSTDVELSVTLPTWRWDSVAAALKDPSDEVQRAALEWLAGLPEGRYAEPPATAAAYFAEVLKDRLAGEGSSTDLDNALRSLRWAREAGVLAASRVAELLKSPDDNVRNSAVGALGQMGTAAAHVAPQVAELLESPDDSVRRSAADALGQMGMAAAGVAPQVAELLKSPDDNVRSWGADALGQMGTAGARYAPQVAELLKSPDDSVRSWGAYALGRMGTAGASYAPQVAELLKSPNDSVRNSAADALGRMGTAGARYAPQVAELLKNPDDSVRSSGASALGRMGAAGASYAPQVAELLKGPNDNVRSSAAGALGQMGMAAAGVAPQVAELVKSRDDSVRSSAAGALGQMGTAAAGVAPQVAELLKSPDDSVRCSAADALGQMGTAGASYAPQVAELLKSRDDSVRSWGAYALGRMGTAGASYAPQVAELLKSRNDSVLRWAANALGRMGAAGASYAPQVAELLKSRDDSVRRSAAEFILNTTAQPDPKLALRLTEISQSYQSVRGFVAFLAYMTGGAEEPSRSRLIWLVSRDGKSRPAAAKLTHTEAHVLLDNLLQTFPLTEGLPIVRELVAKLAADVVRVQGTIEPGDSSLVRDLWDQIKKDFPDQARTLDDALRGHVRRKWVIRGVAILCAHAAFWLLLIFAYPHLPMVQAVFFWNKWTRRMFGLGYVGLAITLIPCLRRRLFQPFRESLIPRRLVDGFNEASYFDQTEVTEKTKSNQPPERRALHDAAAELKGQIVLEGLSGLGKTLLLQQLALRSKSTLVFLRATNCADGVVTAIQRRLQGQAQDETYLKTLIYAGALDVLIDGLNEASPETRTRISEFVEEYFKGNFVVTTQPLNWTPPATARVLQLQPLRPDQIGMFLNKQWAAVEPIARRTQLTQEGYERAVAGYVSALPQVGDPGDPVDPGLLVLCNPMDASLAAELLAQGERPDLFRLVEQRFQTMAAAFRVENGRDFPREAFAERVYEWRKADKADINVEGFEVEATELSEYRLMIQRTDTIKKAQGAEDRTRWFFRHDRIMDFFSAPAFLGPEQKQRRFDHIQDERFWGVYNLLAAQLPDAEERELYAFLNEWAAKANQNELRNRYELARRRRVGRSTGTSGGTLGSSVNERDVIASS